jgi:hypothetical protein
VEVFGCLDAIDQLFSLKLNVQLFTLRWKKKTFLAKTLEGIPIFHSILLNINKY